MLPVHVYTCLSMHVSVCQCMRVSTCVFLCVSVCVCQCVCVCMPMCMHMPRECVRVFICQWVLGKMSTLLLVETESRQPKSEFTKT